VTFSTGCAKLALKGADKYFHNNFGSGSTKANNFGTDPGIGSEALVLRLCGITGIHMVPTGTMYCTGSALVNTYRVRYRYLPDYPPDEIHHNVQKQYTVGR
jgi:hypothetical protein